MVSVRTRESTGKESWRITSGVTPENRSVRPATARASPSVIASPVVREMPEVTVPS